MRSDVFGYVRMRSDMLGHAFTRGQGLEQLHADVEEMVLRPKAGWAKLFVTHGRERTLISDSDASGSCQFWCWEFSQNVLVSMLGYVRNHRFVSPRVVCA